MNAKNNKDCYLYKRIYIGFDLDSEHKVKIARCCVNKEQTYKKWDYKTFLSGNINVLEEFKNIVNNKVEPTRYCCSCTSEDCKFPSWDEIEEFQVSLFTACNAKCSFCFRKNFFNKNSYFLEKQIYLKVINSLKGQGKGIYLTDEGEPFMLLKEMKKWFKELKEDDFTHVSIKTNGILIDDEMIEILKNCKIHVDVGISLNAPNRQLYKEIMGVDAFDKVISNINKLYDAHLFYCVTVVYHEGLFGHLHEFEGLLKCPIKLSVRDGDQRCLTKELKEFENKPGFIF